MKKRFLDLRRENLERSKAAGVAAGAQPEVPRQPSKMTQRELKRLLKPSKRKMKRAGKKTTTPWQRLSFYEGRGSKVSGGLPGLGKRGR